VARGLRSETYRDAVRAVVHGGSETAETTADQSDLVRLMRVLGAQVQLAERVASSTTSA
jgi:hypothetical protein